MEQPADRIFSRSKLNRFTAFQSARLQPECRSRPKAPRFRDRLSAAARFLLRAPRLLPRAQSILERRRVECQARGECRLTPVPLSCATGKNFGVLKRRIPFDLYVSPGKVRDARRVKFLDAAEAKSVSPTRAFCRLLNVTSLDREPE
jgi:hypothetical protein